MTTSEQLPQARSPRKIVRGKAIGRALLSVPYRKFERDLDEIMDAVDGEIHADGAGLLYVNSTTIDRHARSILNVEAMEAAINRTAIPGDTGFLLKRRRAEISLTPSPSSSLDNYFAWAGIRQVTGEGNSFSRICREKTVLEHHLGVPIRTTPPVVWLGHITLPKGSGASGDIADALNDILPQVIEVGPIQILERD
jgi:hypothetical protein